MSYTTEFFGAFKLNKKLDEKTYDALVDFSQERHEYGEYPSIWCDWAPTRDGMGIEWNGTEKFYEYTEWLKYIVKHFLHPKGYVLNGEVDWQGDDRNDVGKIVVVDNEVTEKVGKFTINYE